MKVFLASGNTKKILEMQRILAEHVPGEKDQISHRGRALRALAPQVAADLSGD